MARYRITVEVEIDAATEQEAHATLHGRLYRPLDTWSVEYFGSEEVSNDDARIIPARAQR